MVPRAWLLLSLTACKAVDLGIELPPTGIEAINQEDLKRDIYLGKKAKSLKERIEWISTRLKDMDLTLMEKEGALCGKRVVDGVGIRVGVVDDNSDNVVISVAAMMSLAKAFVRSKQSREFCVLFQKRSFSGVILDNISGENLQFDENRK